MNPRDPLDPVEQDINQHEEALGEMLYYLLLDQEWPDNLREKWKAYEGITEKPSKGFTPNQWGLFTLVKYWMTEGRGNKPLMDHLQSRRFKPDGPELGSGYRSFERAVAMGAIIAAKKFNDSTIERLALGTARAGLAWDCLFACEFERRIVTRPPGVRTGTEPMGLWCTLEMLLEGGPRGNPWPRWRRTNHRIALPAMALEKLLQATNLFGALGLIAADLSGLRAWVLKRDISKFPWHLLAGMRTQWPVLVRVSTSGILGATLIGEVTRTDNIRYRALLGRGNAGECIVHDRKNHLDFYGDAFGESHNDRVSFEGSLGSPGQGSPKSAIVYCDIPRGPIEIRFYPGRDPELNGKVIIQAGQVAPVGEDEPKPVPAREPNFEVAKRRIESAMERMEEAYQLSEEGEAGEALKALDKELSPAGAIQSLRRAVAALRGEIP